MAITSKLYGNAILRAFQKQIDISNDTLKVMLCTSSYTPNQDTNVLKADITGETSGTGYVAGGATLANKSMVYDAATNVIKFDADDVTWANSTITAHYAVIYDTVGNSLLGYVDFGEDISSTNGDFKLTWDTLGIFKITVA